MDFDRVMSRRALIRAMAGGIAVTATLPLLAACGGDDDAAETSTSTSSTSTSSASGNSTSTAAATTESTPAGSSATPQGSPASGAPVTGGSLTVYSGRNENLIGPLMERFSAETGIDVQIRYGDTTELAVAMLEEGKNSPADVFFAQDAGALGAVAAEGMLQELPQDVLDLVAARFRSPEDIWVGITARARTVVYNTEALTEADIPESILGFTDPEWSGRLGWAPTNASFQSFITALRILEGEEAAREWLEGIQANDPRVFEGNSPIVQAVIDGEIDAGFVNHYYLLRQRAEAGADLPAENYFYANGDPGALVNVAGVGILSTAENLEQAKVFVNYLLTEDAQAYFAEETFEYPLLPGVAGDPGLVPLEDIETPDIDLSQLSDLEATLELLRDVGVL